MDIDNNDPSLEQVLIKIYEEDIPFEIRYDDEEENNKNNFQSYVKYFRQMKIQIKLILKLN